MLSIRGFVCYDVPINCPEKKVAPAKAPEKKSTRKVTKKREQPTRKISSKEQKITL